MSSPNPAGFLYFLSGVAASSARSAWAVGSYATSSRDGSLILRWNGKSWKKAPSPAGSLAGVAATLRPQRLGRRLAPASGKTLILHWNGTSWK